MLEKSSRYRKWAGEILDNYIEKISKRRKIELEYVLTEFFKLKAFPRESPENLILRLKTTSERIISLGCKELSKDSFIKCQALERIRSYYPELVSRVWNLALSRRFNILRLQHDRTGHGNENMLIAAHKGKLITGMKFSDKELKNMRSRTNQCVISVQEQRLLECRSTSCTRFETRTLEITSHVTLQCSRVVSRGKDTDMCWHSQITQRSGAGIPDEAEKWIPYALWRISKRKIESL